MSLFGGLANLFSGFGLGGYEGVGQLGLGDRMPLDRHDKNKISRYRNLPRSVNAGSVAAMTRKASMAVAQAKMLGEYAQEVDKLVGAHAAMHQTRATHGMKMMGHSARIAQVDGNYAIAHAGYQQQIGQERAKVDGYLEGMNRAGGILDGVFR